MKNSSPTRKSQIEIKIKNFDADKAAVEKILLSVKAKFNLFDNTHTSTVPDTIKSIVEGDGYGFGLGARTVRNSIFIDFNRARNESQKFEEVHQFILNELKNTFQQDLSEVWDHNAAYCKTH